jgi:hypothetical protein
MTNILIRDGSQFSPVYGLFAYILWRYQLSRHSQHDLDGLGWPTPVLAPTPAPLSPRCTTSTLSFVPPSSYVLQVNHPLILHMLKQSID